MFASRALVALAVIAAASAGGWWLGEQRHDAAPRARVIDVIDGDTIVVAFADGSTDTIRLLGVDTPETHHPTKPVECYGPEAAAYTARRLGGRLVRLEGDVEARDVYGRRLAYVLVSGRRFNDELLRRGYARLLVIAPNRRHAHELLEAELTARHERRGLWRRCDDVA
ncbi:MAG TPA: thermonuclease family protein [Acidimicrobiia bacterium]